MRPPSPSLCIWRGQSSPSPPRIAERLFFKGRNAVIGELEKPSMAVRRAPPRPRRTAAGTVPGHPRRGGRDEQEQHRGSGPGGAGRNPGSFSVPRSAVCGLGSDLCPTVTLQLNRQSAFTTPLDRDQQPGHHAHSRRRRAQGHARGLGQSKVVTLFPLELHRQAACSRTPEGSRRACVAARTRVLKRQTVTIARLKQELCSASTGCGRVDSPSRSSYDK